MSRVLLIVVDGCTSRVLGPALERGTLPVLAALASRGTLRLDCLSVFPSITPAATASIATGCYPARHGIAGMSWWNPSTKSVSYFGDDVWTILQRGPGEFVRECLMLSDQRLRVPTLFQLVERSGRRAACLNFLIFRGDAAYEIAPPLLLRLLTSMDEKVMVHGPSWLQLGDLLSVPRESRHVTPRLFSRLGFDDAATETLLAGLSGAHALPDFTLAYFPDYDFDSHEGGPDRAVATLQRFDQRLGHVIDQWGGLDRVLEQLSIVITADHSHSQIGEGKDSAIVVRELLDGFNIADVSDGWPKDGELLVCPNMRAAEIYGRRLSSDAMSSLASALLEDHRIDHVIWRTVGDSRVHVATADRGQLQFAPVRGMSATAEDPYGGRWMISGDLEALDASLEGDRIVYRAYPNALERIACGVDELPVQLVWVTARPGYEFAIHGQSVHRRGGSHGTLHELDSVVPLLVCPATDRPFRFQPRIVDVAPLCLELLGLPSRLHALGRPHGFVGNDA